MLSVTWSTNITNIVNIAVIASNTRNGLESGIVVGGAEREASLLVDHADPFNVTDTIFDQYQQRFSSEGFYIKGLPDAVPTVTVIPQNTPSTFTSKSPLLNPLCIPKKEVQNSGNNNIILCQFL